MQETKKTKTENKKKRNKILPLKYKADFCLPLLYRTWFFSTFPAFSGGVKNAPNEILPKLAHKTNAKQNMYGEDLI